ncbi:ribosome silencing factor [Roseomonas aerophila]|uniref:Ribosomal silencing factor RsfS n=1 Tax=Teichococcus aerophilus TaxID=1224513 RepID=A0ABR7RUI0_9PROT|nr:ribosome silencing factor [Pseudoroseomonas aerophila]
MAKPAAPKVKRVKLSPPEVDRLVQAAVASLEDDKAEDIVVLDIATRATFADRMIVATGFVERQIQAMATHIEKALAEFGIKRIRTEASPDWVLLDAGDLIVHLFKPETRANYRIEKMWGPDSPVPEGDVTDEEAIMAGIGTRELGEEDGVDDEATDPDTAEIAAEFADDEVIDLDDDFIHIESDGEDEKDEEEEG